MLKQLKVPTALKEDSGNRNAVALDKSGDIVKAFEVIR